MAKHEIAEETGKGPAVVVSTGRSTGKGPDATRRIVVGTDGSANAGRAVVWAAAQALRTGSVLEVATGFGSGYVLTKPSDAKRAMSQVLDAAQDIAESAAPGVVVKRRSLQGSPESLLMQEAEAADLLVVGSRGLGGFKGRLLGSVSRRCVHRAPCPVVVVRGPGDASAGSAGDAGTPATAPVGGAAPDGGAVPDGHQPGRPRVVVGIDGSPSSIAAAGWAARQAELTGAVLEGVMAWELPTSYGMSLPVPSDWDPDHDTEVLLENSLEPVRNAHPDVEIQAAVVEGHPSMILEKASNGADLLVVGSRGHGEFTGMLLGSVSEHCVVHANCPVLVLRDPSDGPGGDGTDEPDAGSTPNA